MPNSLSHEEQKSSKIKRTEKDENFPVKIKDPRPVDFNVQRITTSALRIFKKFSERGLGALMKITRVNLLHTGSEEAANTEESPLYQAMEFIVCQAAARGAANDVIHGKFNSLSESPELIEPLTSILIIFS